MSSRPAHAPVRRRLSRAYLNQRPRISTGGGRRARKQRETQRRTAVICVAVLFISAAIVFGLLAMDRNRIPAPGATGLHGPGSAMAAAHAHRTPAQPLVKLQNSWQQFKAQFAP